MNSRLGRFVLIGLLVLSLLLRSSLLLLLDILLALVAGASALWGRYCLAGVSYARRFETERLFCGESLDVWIEIVNAKPLPLAWLKADDDFPAEFAVDQVELGTSSKPNRRTLINLLSLRWYERVRRRYRLTATRRGAFEFGPAVLSSGDIFGFQMRATDVPERQTVLVYPRLVPVERLRLRAARPGGELNSERRVIEDPLRLAAVRDYHTGDPVRHIHWKSSARRGALQTKLFEPAASQHLLLFLNGQTLERAFEGIVADYFETAVVVAASLAEAALDDRHPVGLFTNNAVREAALRVRLPASRHTSQMARILEVLAQVTHFTQLPFDHLLRLEASQMPFGATVIAITAIVTEPILEALLALQSGGHPAALVVVAEPNRLPALRPPESIPVYYVTESWADLGTLELD